MEDINFKNLKTKNYIWAGILLVQFVLFYTLSFSQTAVMIFANIFKWKSFWHQKLFSLIGFSIGDLLYIILLLIIIRLTFDLFKKNKRRSTIIKILMGLNVIYFIYQCFWGMLYFQMPISEKLPPGEPTLAETKQLAKIYLDKCRMERELTTEDRNGIFYFQSADTIQQDILISQNHVPQLIAKPSRTGIDCFKPSLFRQAMSYSGILGYYNPFTGEAQYNPNSPATMQPFTLAHESAHQLGFAREEEANFVGFLICEQSNNLSLRYSADFYAMKSLLNGIYAQDSIFVKKMLQQYSPKMKRDRAYEKSFAKRHKGLADSFFGFTNDLFLKSNRQEGAITYSYFTELLIRYNRLK